MIQRPQYLRLLRLYRDKPLIKVLTGARRAEKSTILQMFRNEVIAGTDPGSLNALTINFEDVAYRDLLNANALCVCRRA
jgi:predicted AAA+ superfamily ATPase